MVLSLVADYSIRAGFWLIYKGYCGVNYLIYGHQETNEEKILRELQELREENAKLKLLLPQPAGEENLNKKI